MREELVAGQRNSFVSILCVKSDDLRESVWYVHAVVGQRVNGENAVNCCGKLKKRNLVLLYIINVSAGACLGVSTPSSRIFLYVYLSLFCVYWEFSDIWKEQRSQNEQDWRREVYVKRTKNMKFCEAPIKFSTHWRVPNSHSKTNSQILQLWDPRD